ncbi:ATP-dependent Clp protease ATP-binding subunit ClpA [Pontibacter aydingkolensis]|uniref:ATP-dependent Clp protease ATP-binding subunit n=1 Tax=Pontibacter aydingkolensis TaxID=1911536 RepID=A0ABS7CSP6_9BACT|nr:ATP-dependent Clp protease ATP-binding subunit [Pontibacter aydingkolensis]MBW7466853.1 ATP-dependent Clp protease ATP-binding subunit [Pontibacter aydingkolensis]
MNTPIIQSNEVKRVIQIAQSIAREHQHEHFSPAHLLRALLHEEIGVIKFLKSIDKDVHYLKEWAEVRIEGHLKACRGVSEPTGDDRVVAVMDEAEILRLQLSHDEVDPLCVLAALSKPNVAFTKEQLKTFPLSADDVVDTSVENALVQAAISPATTNGSKVGSEKNTTKALHKFCIDKTSLAKEGKIDPIIGRDRETRMMVEILGRRTKPNVLIVGEPGVGKTALVDGFALNIIANNVPAHLQNSFLYELDTGALVAGASYKGEVEDRLKNIIKELKALDKAILFIDELHTFLDSSSAVGSGAANLLKPELARGEITVIGATTNDEFREFIEPEQAFNRRFEVLRVEEPDVVSATRMLQKLIPFYEQHHGVQVAHDAPEEAVNLAKRYVKDRRLPDAAIDLLDRTMAAIRMADETSEKELATLQQQLLTMTENTHSMADLHWFKRELNSRISPILLSQLEESEDDELETPEALYNHLTQVLDDLRSLATEKKGSVEKVDLAAVVAHKTGIPLGKIQTKEREKLLGMEETLQQRVIGQDQAIKVIAEAILENRSGLTKLGQPIGSFFFLGPTGTGKTELAKSIADFLFNDESAMIRFDMSEFKEEHSAALLYGAPPGYVGYKEGGLLVNKIREKPYAVLLFDEVEKAHPSVFDVFLQILDEGKLHDRLGKEGDFSNAVILFTSNIGSDFIVNRFEEQGTLPASSEMMEIMSRHFRPEFLARVTEIVPFAPITEENVTKIFNIHLKKLLETLSKQGITLQITKQAVLSLALSGFTPKYGARPLTGVIRNQLRRPISRMIISEKIGRGSTVLLDVNEAQELTWEVLPKESELISDEL